MNTNTQILFHSLRGTFIDTLKRRQQLQNQGFNPLAFTAGVTADQLIAVLQQTQDDSKEILSEFVGTVMDAALEADENLENISNSLMMSIVYVSKSLKYEPLQLIDYFASYSVEHALKLKANVREVARGLMKGVVVIAKKANLDVESALAVAAASIMKSAYFVLGPKAQVIFTRDGVWLNYFLDKKTDNPYSAESLPLMV